MGTHMDTDGGLAWAGFGGRMPAGASSRQHQSRHDGWEAPPFNSAEDGQLPQPHTLPRGEWLFSPRVAVPVVQERAKEIAVMHQKTRYLLAYYLSFDELVEAENGERVLNGVLQRFLDECFGGAPRHVVELLLQRLGPSVVSIPKLVRDVAFPGELCTAVCCEHCQSSADGECSARTRLSTRM